jgi:hypothetical protein
MPKANAKSGPSRSAAARKDQLANIAENTLSFFNETVARAQALLDENHVIGASTLASVNTLNAGLAIQNLSSISDEIKRELRHLCAEPAIARLVLRDESDKEEIYFISRTGSPPAARGRGIVASYRSPIGRLASLPVGADQQIRTPTGVRSFELVERAALHPALTGAEWDSINTVLQNLNYGPLTVVSLRELLRTVEPGDDVDLLDSLLAEGRAADNVLEGLRRSAIMKMGLRDQPLLDQYQDEIFRLPLDTRLVILGPPGTGKTTTLIKRLGLKLDSGFLEEDEQSLVAQTMAGPQGHGQSWLMFTPTELLKQYVKESFNREGIAASDLRIQTWNDFRRELARNQLGVLRTATGSGSFVLKDTLASLQASTLERQTQWFEQFSNWQADAFWSELQQHAETLAQDADQTVSRLGKRLVEAVDSAPSNAPVTRFFAIAEISEAIAALLERLRIEADGKIRSAFARELKKDPALLTELVKFVGMLSDGVDDQDDPEADEDEEIRQPRAEREAAFDAYTRAVRAQARGEVTKRAVGKQTKNGRIIEWLGTRSLPLAELQSVGQSLQLQASARRFVNPLRRYIAGIPLRYRRFRREQQAEGRWYRADSFALGDLAPLEVDLIVLAMLRVARGLLADRRISRDVDQARYASLKTIQALFRTQILVDEATDFSPVQLACMAALCDPASQSFLACGDFNQRITEWGSRSEADLKWVFPDIEVRSINISYRHSRQLNEFAKRVALLSSPDAPDAQLPAHVDNEGVPPVLVKGLSDRLAVAAWLTDRIVEIERFTGTMPSIAVLVNDEEDVVPVATALDAALTDKNIRAVPCSRGQTVGQENDVRVFDVQHIKGLEFEAVFFVSVDELATRFPALFDKYLYVGATRAAYYLGLTTSGPSLPPKLLSLEDAFYERWP